MLFRSFAAFLVCVTSCALQPSPGVHEASLDADPESPWVELDVTDCDLGKPPTPFLQGVWAGPGGGPHARIADVDLSALYWVAHLPVLDPETYGQARFEIRGAYPEARYFSFHLYADGVYEDHLRDTSIKPVEGSVNTFISGYPPLPPSEQRQYRIELVDFDKSDLPDANVLHGGTIATGATVTSHTLMLRQYDANTPSGEPPGLVPLPRIVLLVPQDATLPAVPTTQVGACALIDPELYGDPAALAEQEAAAEARVNSVQALAGVVSVPGYQPGPTYDVPRAVFGGNVECTMGFLFPATQRPDQPPADCSVETTGGAFNFDQRYVFDFLDPTRGAAALRMKIPTSAKRGDPMLSVDAQARYSSLCLVQTENSMYTYGCLRDDEMVRDATNSSFATFVFSARRDKPAWACDVLAGQRTGCSANWLPFTSPVNWLHFRQLAPADDFAESTMSYVGHPNDYAALHEHMGPYYPVGRYCSSVGLRRDACGLGLN